MVPDVEILLSCHNSFKARLLSRFFIGCHFLAWRPTKPTKFVFLVRVDLRVYLTINLILFLHLFILRYREELSTFIMAGRPRSRPRTLEECWSIYPDTKAQMLPNIYKDVDVLTGGLGQDVEYFRIGGTADAATERGPLRKLIDYAIWDSDVYQDPWPDQVFEKKLKSDVDGLVSRIVEKIQKIHADIDPPTDWLVCWITALVIFWPGGRLALEYKKDDPKESIPPGGSGAKYGTYRLR